MTLDPSLRHWHTRLDDLDACAEHAPEGLYVTAIAVRGLIGDAADQIIKAVRGLGLEADNSDDIRDVEAAIYRYVVRSNLASTEFTSAESFGRHATDPDTRDRVIANAIRDRDALAAVNLVRDPVPKAPATNPDRAQIAALAEKGITPHLDIDGQVIGVGDRVQLSVRPYVQGTVIELAPNNRLLIRSDDYSTTKCPSNMVRRVPLSAAIGSPGDTPSQAFQRLVNTAQHSLLARTPVNLTAVDINRLATLAADHQRLSDAVVDHGKGHTTLRLQLPRGYVNIADQVAYDVLTVVDSRVCDEARRMGVELLTTTTETPKEPAND